jgi:hypothetical protein
VHHLAERLFATTWPMPAVWRSGPASRNALVIAATTRWWPSPVAPGGGGGHGHGRGDGRPGLSRCRAAPGHRPAPPPAASPGEAAQQAASPWRQ